MNAKFKYAKATEFYQRAIDLPTKLIFDEDFKEFPKSDFNEENRGKFKQRKYERILKFQDLILEVLAFIKVCYGQDSDYYKHVNGVEYLTEHRGIIMNEFNVQQNNIWQEGRKKLISLLVNIQSEEKQRKDMEAFLENPTRQTLIVIGASVAMIVAFIAIWMAPDEVMVQTFAKEKIFTARCGLSVSCIPLYLIAFSKKDWLSLLGVWGTLFAVVMGFLR